MNNNAAQAGSSDDADSNEQYFDVFSEMTVKQHDVFACLAENRTSKEIASRLQVSESAIVQRIEAVRSRTGSPPRAELARAYRHYLQSGFFDVRGSSSAMELPDEAFPSPWQKHVADWILPAALVGENAGLNRIAAMVVIAAGLLLVALAGIGLAHAMSLVG